LSVPATIEEDWLSTSGCPSQLLCIIASSHDNMKGTISYNGEAFEPFSSQSVVKLCPCTNLVCHIFLYSTTVCSRKVPLSCILEVMGCCSTWSACEQKQSFVHVCRRCCPLYTHTKDALQQLIDRFYYACKEVGLTINIKKTNIVVLRCPFTTRYQHLSGKMRETTDQLSYFGSTIICLVMPKSTNALSKTVGVMSP
jgi:hypothetical protein